LLSTLVDCQRTQLHHPGISSSQVTISAPTWSSAAQYIPGAVVTGSDSHIYVSVTFNRNNNPVGSSGFWVPMWTQTNVQVVVGTSTGVGYQTGSSQNTLQHQFIHLQYNRCARGISIVGGNAQITQPSGGQSDIGIYISGFVPQKLLIDYYASESDFVAIVANPAQNQTFYSAASLPLPTCNSPNRGMRAVVSDATSPTYLGTYVGGGSVVAPVFCNGSNWLTD
jgi:hypothetical protein